MENSNLIQLFSFAAILASSVFIPLISEQYGAGPIMVGVIVGAYNAMFMLSNYLFGYLSDKYGGKFFLRFGLLLSALVFALQIMANDLPSLFWLRALVGFAAGTFPAALTVFAYVEHKGKMGQYAGYGSLGWGIGGLLAGFIANNDTIFLLSSLFFFVAFLLSFQIGGKYEKQVEPSLLPWRIVRSNLRVYLPYFLRALGAQAIWSIFPLYLVFTGADKTLIGLTYFINLASQFFLMQYVERFRNLYLINIGLLCTVITFFGYAMFPYLPVVMAFQLLLSISFSTLQVGALQEILTNNRERSSAVGLLNSIGNFTAVIGPFLAGFIAQGFGYSGVMWFGMAISFLGLITFTTLLE
ncbi:hypothetical protein A2311_03220 [candidate division WOR-1 bacterium RIFOXYB2_FULL_48_7]|uniref:Major facilitator superfamily (MFS) profile domain-containing protein n=1 Tax=candidate division WOR-1 bacterium RIFOXYB2_FULL_48_7 TaxID=1802583 RepID=A0A1F4T8X2_UNCSA|nr:MAG: hypothetical protein A2311_03220 [candidate division WOR-1 bacterium RIFOXYB2_FULL_48_7]